MKKVVDILKVSCVSNSYFRLCLCCKPVAGLLVFLCSKISYNLFLLFRSTILKR